MNNWPRARSIAVMTLVTLIALAACGASSPAVAPTAAPAAAMPAPAPEIGIAGQEKWFNSVPLTLAGLHGAPVFLVFWSDI